MNYPRIVVLGDSIAFGEHLPTTNRWASLLAEANPKWNILVRAVCGDTTRLALERWHQDVASASPDVVIVQLGHNDANDWDGLPRVSARAYESNLIEMCERAGNLGAKVVLCAPHPVVRDSGYERRVREYGESVWRAGSAANADVCDLHAGFPRGAMLDRMLLDGLHLSPAGHELTSRLIQPHAEHAIRASAPTGGARDAVGPLLG